MSETVGVVLMMLGAYGVLADDGSWWDAVVLGVGWWLVSR